MATRKKRKLKRLAMICGSIAIIYFLAFFLIQIMDLGISLPDDWINTDLHYLIACAAIICFLLYTSIVIRIYTRQAIPSAGFNSYIIFGVILGILFVTWAVGLLMSVLNIS